MANTIEIVVKTTDQTKAGLAGIQKNAEGLKTTLKGVGTTMSGVLGANIAVEAGKAFGEFVSDSVHKASDLNESINAVQVTFGASSKTILDWGKNNAAAFGLSQEAFNSLATPLGAMLKNTGLGMQDVSKWTIDLTKRAADMASVFNTSVPDAMEAIQAGLRGEQDPLEKYGVSLSAAKVQAEALAENAGKTASQLTTQEMATARLNIIMKQTAQTQGDFANTSDGAANAMRKATANIDNAEAALGNALLPTLGKVAGVVSTVAGAFAGLPGPLQATVIVVGALGTAVLLLAPKFAAAKVAMTELSEAAGISQSTMMGWGKTAGVIGGVVVATQLVGASFGRAANGVNTVEQALKDYTTTGKETSGITEDLRHAFANLDQNGLQGATNSTEKFLESITGLVGLDKVGDTIHNSAAQIHELDAALASLVGAGNTAEAARQFDKLSQVAKEQGYSVDQIKSLFPAYNDALAGATTANQTAAPAIDKTALALTKQNDAAAMAANGLLGVRGATRNLEQAYDDATAAIKKNGKTTDEGTEKGRANAAALDQIVTSAHDMSDAILKAKGSQASANAVLVTARGRFIAAAQAAGTSADAARRLADQLFAIPKNVNIKINASDSATRVINGVYQRLQQINGTTAYVNVVSTNRNAIEGRRTGGIIGAAAGGGFRGGLTLVGEDGPELLDAAPGSRVHSNPDTMRMLSGGGGGALQLEVVSGSTGGLEAFVGEIVRRFVRVRGGDVQRALGGN